MCWTLVNVCDSLVHLLSRCANARSLSPIATCNDSHVESSIEVSSSDIG